MSETLVAAIIASVCGLIGGFVAALFAYKTQKPLSMGNASLVNTQANVALLGPLTERLNSVEDELEEVKRKLDAEHIARVAAEAKLVEADLTIKDLREADRKRGRAMDDLKEQFEKENLLSTKALKLAHEKIASLEISNSALLDRVSALENERKGWDSERRVWRNGIAILIDQVIKHDDVPGWRPPDTQPLGKVTA